MNLRLSIVVPVYNAANFLPNCFSCIEAQGLDSESYEVIFVDDASTDDSPHLLEEFANRHPEAKILRRPTNGGAGAARNTGIKAAQGEYLYFLDADDSLDEGALPTLMHHMQSNDLDLLFFSGRVAYESPEVEEANPQAEEYFIRHQPAEVISGRDLFVLQQATNNFCGVPYLQLTRRVLITQNSISFPVGIINEDNAFVLLTTLAAERASSLTESFHTYLVRSGSATTASSIWQRYNAHVYLADLANRLIYQAQDENDQELAQALSELRGYWLLVIEQAVAQLSPTDYHELTYQSPSIMLDERMLYRPFADVLRLLGQAQEEKQHEYERAERLQGQNEQLSKSLLNQQQDIVHMQELLEHERANEQQAIARIRELENSTTWKVGRIVTVLPRALKTEFLKRRG